MDETTNKTDNNFDKTDNSKYINNNKIIAIVGLSGSGKSVATEFFENKGFTKIRFGQITMDILREKGLEINETNEREIREGLRKEHGMGAYAIANIPKIEDLLAQKKDVVLDGLYSWSEYKILKNRFKDQLLLLSIQASPAVRYKRLAERKIRPLNIQEASSRDHSEIENIEKAGPIAIANYTVINNDPLEVFRSRLLNLYNGLYGIKIKKQISNTRPSKVDYYLEIAKQVCKRSTCLRRRFGAVVVSKSDKIIATGYNGAIRKAKDCMEIGQCMRQALCIPPGQRYELCKSFHAEQNALMAADPSERRGATLYLHGEMVDGSPSYCEPCMMCKRTIVQSEISKVIGRQHDGSIKEWDVQQFIAEENIGKNFPDEIRQSKEFKDYMKRLK
ncbi:MAG: AAA family ATPase [Candidatus Woesearchaeota archaeon]